MKKSFLYILLVFSVLSLATTYSRAYAENAATIAKKLKQEKQQAEKKKKTLTTLKRKATRLQRTLTEEEAIITNLSRTIEVQEKKYTELEAKNKKLATEYNELNSKNKLTQKELISLVKKLWPLYINSRVLASNAAENWDELDRRYTWASKLYATVEEKQRALLEQEAKLKLLATKQTALSTKAKEQLANVNGKKDKLLQQKLRHSKQLKKISEQRASAEASLRDILSIIGTLNYKLEEKSKTGANFSLLKGVLPWPAHGVIAKRFKPKAKPPVRGIGLALQKDSKIQAVSSGKVVHNDVLRGFGRVVIVMHGEEYYSLYAFLADSTLNVGDTVKQKQVIGNAGFYPAVDGPGMYFELRFHQKAINPETWLSALN
ncbi:murein hydrolase activator EnvC family protein [Halodesulfovibrio marinisediminis]|uniref:Septal ring factor EnvC, activator of murein hydrolases AmiA and AmiB n=1 Tax=Halodesulfovibrio marinisediminis DSM 17456 TaxID=1121457 RepID=A0A1N6DKP8_9BACT|nr:peptidoglycan DD-metalloendopeptidase family protein [Halodesulfovibrio marinisediminis]SIN71253.1 Septal ring factor EnvC, activator of murein hydrolases AmiA and AmiB [Halodesulfovibrio marinisediminis DSM 17456]